MADSQNSSNPVVDIIAIVVGAIANWATKKVLNDQGGQNGGSNQQES